jgi:hypothetical protein
MDLDVRLKPPLSIRAKACCQFSSQKQKSVGKKLRRESSPTNSFANASVRRMTTMEVN